MILVINEAKFHSTEGDPKHSGDLTVRLDGSKPECPITFYDRKDRPVFSMGNDEVPEFCELLKTFHIQ